MRVTAETRFAIIPEWVLFARISPNAVRLYGVLARHADKDEHFAIVGRAKLAEQMRCEVKTIDRAMNELMGIGAVSVEHRSDPNNPLHLLPNRYRLAVVPAQGTPTHAPTPTRRGTRTTGGTPTDVAENERVLGSKALRSTNTHHTPGKAAAPRPRDAIFEALCEVQGHGWDALNSAERGKLNRALRLAHESKASPEAIREAAGKWPEVMGDATMTAIGVMSNFHRLLTGPVRINQRGVDPSVEEQRREREAKLAEARKVIEAGRG